MIDTNIKENSKEMNDIFVSSNDFGDGFPDTAPAVVKPLPETKKATKEELEESQSKIKKALKKKKDAEMSGREFGKKSVLDNERIRNETIQSRVFDVLYSQVNYDPITKQVYVLREDGSQTYRRLDDEELLSRIEKIISVELNAFMYDKNDTYESCLKTFFTKILGRPEKHIEMRMGVFCVKLKGTNKFTFMKIKLMKDGTAKCKVMKPSTDKRCYILLGCEASLSNFEDADGFTWNGEDYSREFYYVGEPAKDGLFMNYINTSFKKKCFSDMTARFFGAALAGLKVSTAMVLKSNGGTGKTVLMNTTDAFFNGISVDYDPSDTGRFAEQPLLGANIANIDESGKTVKEKTVKKIIGNSKMTIDVKYRKPVTNYPMDRISMFFYVNEMFVFKDQHESMERRFLFIPMTGKIAKGDIIEGLEEKIVKGSGVDEDGDEIFEKNKKGQMVHYESDFESVMAWIIKGAIEAVEKGGVPSALTIEDKDIKDFNDSILMKVNKTREFFNEFDIRPAQERATGITKNDLFTLYVDYMKRNNNIPTSKGTFFTNFETKFLSVFDVDISGEYRVGARRGRGYPVVLELPEGEYDHLKLEFNTHVLSDEETQRYTQGKKDSLDRIQKNNIEKAKNKAKEEKKSDDKMAATFTKEDTVKKLKGAIVLANKKISAATDEEEIQKYTTALEKMEADLKALEEELKSNK